MEISGAQLSYAGVGEFPRRSWTGVVSFWLAMVDVPVVGVFLLGVAGLSGIADDPSGDAGGALMVLGAFGVMVAASLVIGLLGVTGVVLAAVGLWRTRRRCWWSWVGGILHVVMMVGVLLVWKFGG